MKYLNATFFLILLTGCNTYIQQSRQVAADTTVDAASELLAATSSLKRKIKDKVDEHPNSSSADFIKVVDKKIDQLEFINEQVRGIKEKDFSMTAKKDLDKIRFYQEKLSTLSTEIAAINTSFDRELDKKLKSDISFNTGSAILSEKGKQELVNLVENDIKKLIIEWESQPVYANKTKKVRVTVNGYADLQGTANEQERKTSNLKLSEKRAKAVANVLLQELNNLKNEHLVDIELTHSGRGEEPPPGIKDLTLRNNPNRRVCIMSTYVIPVF
jgi:outer membrane protein OmpA-like peptidoglycan-associated protein